VHVIINGEMLPRDLAKVQVSDSLISTGEALRISFRVHNSLPLRLERHIDRLALALSSPYIALPFAVSGRTLQRQISELCARDGLYDAIAHYIISPGENAALISDFRDPPKVTTILYLEEITPYRKLTENGIRLWISPFKRVRGDLSAVFPYGSKPLQATRMAVREGYDDAVITDESGNLLNVCCGNLFAVVDGALITPHLQKDGVYPGVMRELVLSEAAKMGIVVYQEPLTPEVCVKASEFFVTSSALEVAFVREIGGRIFREFPISAKFQLACIEQLLSEKPAI